VNWWNTTNEGSKTFDEDAFLAQLVFFHPRNDAVGRYKWWGDQAAGAATQYGGNALVAYGGALRNSAITEVPIWRVESASRILVAGPDGIAVVDQITASRTPTTVIDADTLARSGKYLKAGKALPYVGGALAIGGAGWDQWRDDAKNPDLSTTDRAGRAVGVGTYVGGASIAGATIGTMILPVGGTAAGLVVGAGVGLLAGAAASSWTPAKEFAADAGQWTANAAVDSYHWTGDRIDDIGDGLKSVSKHIPDLNPF
jgi:hypothetical protein